MSANQNWATSDFTVSNQSLIIYFVIMFLLGAFAITLHIKAKGKSSYVVSWCDAIFFLWSLFIAPLIFYLLHSSSISEAISSTILAIIVMFLFTGMGMTVFMMIYGFIWHIICKKKDDVSWFEISFLGIIGVLTGIPLFIYFTIFD